MKATIALIILLVLSPIARAQTAKSQSSPAPSEKQQIELMKGDMEKIRFSLAQMKANLLTLRDPNEVDRWRNNADMWEAMIDQMDHMLQLMEARAANSSNAQAGKKNE